MSDCSAVSDASGARSATCVSEQYSDCSAVSAASGARSATCVSEQYSDCSAVSDASGARSATDVEEQVSACSAVSAASGARSATGMPATDRTSRSSKTASRSSCPPTVLYGPSGLLCHVPSSKVIAQPRFSCRKCRSRNKSAGNSVSPRFPRSRNPVRRSASSAMRWRAIPGPSKSSDQATITSNLQVER